MRVTGISRLTCSTDPTGMRTSFLNSFSKVQELTVFDAPGIMCIFLSQDGKILLLITQMWVTHTYMYHLNLKSRSGWFTTGNGGAIARVVDTEQVKTIDPYVSLHLPL